MSSSCCVPRCTSNYSRTDRITVFKFPKDLEQRKKWLNAIHRKDFIIKESTVICIKHFDNKFIIRNDTAVRPDGSVLIVPRAKIKLTNDAYPTIFNNQPLYMSKSLPPTRRDSAERMLGIEAREEERRKKKRGRR